MILNDTQDPILIKTLSQDLVNKFVYNKDDERDLFTQMIEHAKS